MPPKTLDPGRVGHGPQRPKDATPWQKLMLHVRTLRNLEPVQIYSRLRPFPRFRPVGQLPLRNLTGEWLSPIIKPVAQLGYNRFRFLNQEREITCWNDPTASKLWLYNLHYFEHVDGSLVERWIEENPPVAGVGWDPYPTSLRVANWCKWILSGARPSQQVLSSLTDQAAWIEKRLEWHLLANHLLANAKALIFAGSLFTGEIADRWLTKGNLILDEQLRRQILSDGAHVERSPMYHSIVLEDMLDLCNLRRASPFSVSNLSGYVSRMLGWLERMVHPDGEISFFNDAALGVAPDRASLENYARRLGISRTRVQLGESGYRRMDDGPIALIFDAAPLGPDYQPGHGHADALSFELSFQEHRVLVNSGTSTYDAGPTRSYEVGTAAHNTLRIDGFDQSEMWGAFRVARRAKTFHVRTDQYSFVEAAHDGYCRLDSKVIHRRRIDIARQIVIVRDFLEGEGDHHVEIFFHLAPGATPGIYLDRTMTRETVDSNYCVGFNLPVPNQTVIGRWFGKCPAHFETLIDLGPNAPSQPAATPVAIRITRR
jgi:hypothetical protein